MDTFEIQTDFITNEFLELASLVEPGMLNQAVKAINAKQTTSEDMRPRATDKKGVSYLVDTGAAVSCYPVHKVRNPVLDPSVRLRAVMVPPWRRTGIKHSDSNLGPCHLRTR